MVEQHLEEFLRVYEERSVKVHGPGLSISTAETDLDPGMYAYEIRCRLRRYSRYRDAPFDLLFCDGEGRGWRLAG